jgi:hypothetical protein
MDITLLQDNQLLMHVTDIQYIPYHRYPQCGALPVPATYLIRCLLLAKNPEPCLIFPFSTP